MQKKHNTNEVGESKSLPVVEVLVVITIITALLLGVILSTNPLGQLTYNTSQSSDQPQTKLPPLHEAKKQLGNGMTFATVMNQFPQVIGGYMAPYPPSNPGFPFYLEVSLRDRIAPISRVVARIGQQEIPLTLIDGTEQDGTWGGVWAYTGESTIKIISYDQKDNKTEMEVR